MFADRLRWCYAVEQHVARHRAGAKVGSMGIESARCVPLQQVAATDLETRSSAPFARGHRRAARMEVRGAEPYPMVNVNVEKTAQRGWKQ